jgi:micrococcal nuclease
MGRWVAFIVAAALAGTACGDLADTSEGSFSTTSAPAATTAPTSTSPPNAGEVTDTSALTAMPLIPNARVEWVIDGDTIEVDIDGIQETVRFIGIDTPEKTGGLRPAECYGDEASARMQQLLEPGDAIRLELDVEARDRYDRLLAYVHSPDGLLNEIMVRDGYADAIRFEPNTTLAVQLEAAEAHAREFNLGLWGACGGPDVLLDPVD